MEELLKQIIGRLDSLDGRIDNIEKKMATKDELNEFKQSTIAEFKQIRQTMATKTELAEIKNSIHIFEENQRNDEIT